MRAAIIASAPVILMGCAPGAAAPPPAAGQAAFTPVYVTADKWFESDDLVGIRVAMTGARAQRDVTDFADCAIARHALGAGYGFARQLRSEVAERGGIWRADAVYTMSPALPRGPTIIDAEVTVAQCDEAGIPTVQGN